MAKFKDELKVDSDTFKLIGIHEPKIGTRCNIPELGGWVEFDGEEWNILNDYDPENKSSPQRGE